MLSIFSLNSAVDSKGDSSAWRLEDAESRPDSHKTWVYVLRTFNLSSRQSLRWCGAAWRGVPSQICPASLRSGPKIAQSRGSKRDDNITKLNPKYCIYMLTGPI
ncbi:hypothetical protein AVEN_5371-1 [Araneus ventricosus]|uniref:Uncharacterized protein n=1 Tax=Araneus ventricosus TaxID=182803 RepID=A0A4Y2U335_ARAVE|nr:hypothetical protein AVEN_5371-1 [Araneus ventricosus]